MNHLQTRVTQFNCIDKEPTKVFAQIFFCSFCELLLSTNISLCSRCALAVFAILLQSVALFIYLFTSFHRIRCYETVQ